MQRRLSAILAADVVGYSRLMGANEVGTLQSLQRHQAELIEPEITARGGRIVKLTGDGILAEFPSVVGAVECATAIQRAMPGRNAEVPEDRRIEFRMGINLGDVIVEGEDLFGDGVNVAARLEGVARPGGIAVSQSVREHIGNKLELGFDDRGEEQLKNIERPVRVFDVVLDEPAPAVAGDGECCAAPEKPSIAVLPFTNMSGDPEQEFFSDGISEDIITDLSKISALFVVGRNTSFTYKGMSFQLPKVAAELGVKFLLEGSVRKAGERVRVTAQLIDGHSGGHVWADRYDRDLTDIFAIQDEITRAIVEQLKIRLVPAEQLAISQAPTDNVEAYTYYLKGRRFFHNSTKWFLGLARQMFAKAIELDPMYARAYAGIANCDSRLTGWYAVAIPFDGILAMAEKALALDPGLADAHAARGYVFDISGRPAEAQAAFERALELDPNSFEAHYFYGRFWIKQDNPERAADELIRALEVNPEDAQAALHVYMVLYALGRHEEGEKYARLGLKRAEEALRQHPESSRPAQLGGAALARLGETEEAKRWMERALAIDPDDTHVLYNAACMWTQLGETERALDLLEKWSGFVGVETSIWLKHDSDLDSLRDHPRYAKIVERIDAGAADRAAKP